MANNKIYAISRWHFFFLVKKYGGEGTENIKDANEILDLISYFYTKEYSWICEDVLKKQYESEGIDKMALVKKNFTLSSRD